MIFDLSLLNMIYNFKSKSLSEGSYSDKIMLESVATRKRHLFSAHCNLKFEFRRRFDCQHYVRAGNREFLNVLLHKCLCHTLLKPYFKGHRILALKNPCINQGIRAQLTSFYWFSLLGIKARAQIIIIIIIMISILNEDNVLSMTAKHPYGPPMNTDIDYYRTFCMVWC